MKKICTFLVLTILFSTARSENLISLEYSRPSLLFGTVGDSQIDNVFRYKNITNDRYEINIQTCTSICSVYGIGYGSENFSLKKFSEGSVNFISYNVNTEYIFLTYKISFKANNYTELGVFLNVGNEKLILSKNNTSSVDSDANTSYARIESGGYAKLFIPPNLFIKRFYIISGLSLYLKSIENIYYDNQEFKKTELMGLNFILNLGVGFSF
jgi:hypothetical protein